MTQMGQIARLAGLASSAYPQNPDSVAAMPPLNGPSTWLSDA